MPDLLMKEMTRVAVMDLGLRLIFPPLVRVLNIYAVDHQKGQKVGADELEPPT
ncbi:MAG: hypothetical protein ACK2UK_09665 [Candidatus Promineifilaceae bacterium]|jgi:hypothetical protein